MSKKPNALPDPQTIDELYGLEPVYEPEGSAEVLNAHWKIFAFAPPPAFALALAPW